MHEYMYKYIGFRIKVYCMPSPGGVFLSSNR
jgi:hypothetical protein